MRITPILSSLCLSFTLAGCTTEDVDSVPQESGGGGAGGASPSDDRQSLDLLGAVESPAIPTPVALACPVGPCGVEPVVQDGARCGTSVCDAGEYCCNESCGICAPIGGACTQQFCEAPVLRRLCGMRLCEVGEFCCNESCGICAPIGAACTQEACGPPPTVVIE